MLVLILRISSSTSLFLQYFYHTQVRLSCRDLRIHLLTYSNDQYGGMHDGVTANDSTSFDKV